MLQPVTAAAENLQPAPMNQRVSVPRSLDRATLIEKCNAFTDFQLWPLQSIVDPEGWLNNFQPSEMQHALHLLNAFIYYNEGLVQELVIGGFHNLSSKISERKSFSEAQASWEQFCSELIVTNVTGEDPNITDSGYGFARILRQQASIKEEQFFSQIEALKALDSKPNRGVIFVDDFVGSGDQMLVTWTRRIDLGGRYLSFDEVADRSLMEAYYCPAICTTYGRRNLRLDAKLLNVSAGNVLPAENSAFHTNSVVWPDDLRSTGPSFLKEASSRAGIPNHGGHNDWRGYHRLGLSLAFSHSTPDATLPIFHWERNGWRPLVQRR